MVVVVVGWGAGSDLSGKLSLWRGVRGTFEGQVLDDNKVAVEK